MSVGFLSLHNNDGPMVPANLISTSHEKRISDLHFPKRLWLGHWRQGVHQCLTMSYAVDARGSVLSSSCLLDGDRSL